MMAPKVILYMGAPEDNNINWEATKLLSDFDPTLLRLIPNPPTRQGGRSTANTPDTPDTPDANLSLVISAAPVYSAWRYLRCTNLHLTTGCSQLEHLDHPLPPHLLDRDAQFFSWDCQPGTTQPSSAGEDSEKTTEFYNHSLAVHESQTQTVADESFSLLGDDSCMSDDPNTSFLSDANGLSPSQLNLMEPLGRFSYTITSLADIPRPDVIAGFCTASVTVSLVVGIISITAPFPVRTRWGSREVVELIVGDETKSGFNITFWLSNVYRTDLESLRRQDVVLLRNIALSPFRKAVHGNSLRSGLTKTHLLFRKMLHPSDLGGYYRRSDIMSSKSAHPQLEKTRRVREWVLRFVGPDVELASNRQRVTVWDQPPNDSQ